MEIEITKNETREKNVLIWLGVSVIVLTFIYFFSITFFLVPPKNERYGDLILGYVSGLVSAIVGYYWGGSNHRNPPAIDATKKEEPITSPVMETETQMAYSSENREEYNDDEFYLDHDDLNPPIKG